MIYNMRVYDLKFGAIPEYMAAVKELAVKIRAKHGVKLAGWYYTEIGTQHRVVHIWEYKDYTHFEEAAQAVRSDPQWVNEYVPRVRDLIVGQQDSMMRAPDWESW